MTPLVTIGLPCCNEQKFVAHAVASILAQSLQDWEMVAIDDGSSDATADILRGLRDPRIRVVIDGRHRGLAARLNEIARLAAGKYVARMDADDVAHPQRLQKQVEFLESHADVDVTGTGMAIVDENEKIIGKRLPPAEPYTGGRAPVIAHATMCSRADWVRQHPYNENNPRCEDWELWRSVRRATIRNLEEPLYFYREFDSFGTRKYLARQMRIMRVSAFDGDVRQVLLSAFGCGVYGLAAATGTTRRLLRRRSESLVASEEATLQAVYDSVLRLSLEEAQQTAAARNP